MIPVRGLDHFVLRVQQLERALAFYRDLLGLEVLCLDEFQAGQRPFVSLRIGGQLLDLVPDPSFAGAQAEPNSGFLHFCLLVEGKLQDFIPLLRERGVPLLDDQPAWRMGARGWGWSVYVRDPDGYVVELKEWES
ncbi:MAG: ring-cleaving dioxygenase [Candidatus Binatia bacterium]|nr:MAG: ring-cleaving dioxygenase [Candidatus Binatia bacterium]